MGSRNYLLSSLFYLIFLSHVLVEGTYKFMRVSTSIIPFVRMHFSQNWVLSFWSKRCPICPKNLTVIYHVKCERAYCCAQIGPKLTFSLILGKKGSNLSENKHSSRKCRPLLIAGLTSCIFIAYYKNNSI